MRLSIAAYAKINLTLDVLQKLPSGYHELCMVMQSIDLHDDLFIETDTNAPLTLRTNAKDIPCDDRNLVAKAVRCFFEATAAAYDGISVVIEKRIPVMAGLAGGSTNAAAMLRALNYIYNTKLSLGELQKIGLEVGADVPFCIAGGTMLAGGIGDILSPLPELPACSLVLVKPAFAMSTAYVFNALDKKEILDRPKVQAMTYALSRGDLSGISSCLRNVMEGVTAEEYPQIHTIKEQLLSAGALGAVMSGSGPTVYGIFEDNSKARNAYMQLLPLYESVHLCRPQGKFTDSDFVAADIPASQV